MRLEMKIRDQKSSSGLTLTLRLFELMRHISQMGGGGGFGAPKATAERRQSWRIWRARG
jgi:hypothetical protein